MTSVQGRDPVEAKKALTADPSLAVKESLFTGTLLHDACSDDLSDVVALILAHPDVNVNGENKAGCTPFMMACFNGATKCVRLLLLDSRVNLNLPNKERNTPLRQAAYYGHVAPIRWWIASGRDLDLGRASDGKTNAIEAARKQEKPEVVTLLEKFKENPEKTRQTARKDLRCDGEEFVPVLSWGCSSTSVCLFVCLFVSFSLCGRFPGGHSPQAHPVAVSGVSRRHEATSGAV